MTAGNRLPRRYGPTIARILMGLAFFVFGLDGFLHFIPQPQMDPKDPAAAFGIAMHATGYFLYLLKATELTTGVLLLANRFVPLALILIAPVLVNIIAFHLFLAPKGIAPGAILLALELYLAWTYRAAYRNVLAVRFTP